MSNKNINEITTRKRGRSKKKVDEDDVQPPKNSNFGDILSSLKVKNKEENISKDEQELKEKYEKYKRLAEYQKNYYQKNKDKFKQKYNERKAVIKQYEELQQRKLEENKVKSDESDDIMNTDIDLDIDYTAMCNTENEGVGMKMNMVPCYIAGRNTPAFYIPQSVVMSRGNIEVCMTNVFERL